jgi:transaldolase
VVNTMPEATLRAVIDHGPVQGDTVRGRAREAQQTLDDLRSLGVDYDDVVRGLENDAVRTFEASWRSLATALGDQLSSTTEPANATGTDTP